MSVNGKKQKLMVTELIHGQMVQSMWACGKIERQMAEEFLPSLTESHLKDFGEREDS